MTCGGRGVPARHNAETTGGSRSRGSRLCASRGESLAAATCDWGSCSQHARLLHLVDELGTVPHAPRLAPEQPQREQGGVLLVLGPVLVRVQEHGNALRFQVTGAACQSRRSMLTQRPTSPWLRFISRSLRRGSESERALPEAAAATDLLERPAPRRARAGQTRVRARCRRASARQERSEPSRAAPRMRNRVRPANALLSHEGADWPTPARRRRRRKQCRHQQRAHPARSAARARCYPPPTVGCKRGS